VPAPSGTIDAIAGASDWNSRVARIRQIPQRHGTDEHMGIYAAVAKRVYVPNLAPDFAYVHWRDDYALEPFLASYEAAAHATEGFTQVDARHLTDVILEHPTALRSFASSSASRPRSSPARPNSSPTSTPFPRCPAAGSRPSRPARHPRKSRRARRR